MKENIKLIASIGTRTFLKWLMTVALGILITITCLVVVYNSHPEVSAESSFLTFPWKLMRSNFMGFLVIVASPIFLVLYFLVANKSVIQTSLNLLWKKKAGHYISDKVGRLAKNQKFEKGNKFSISNAAVLKARMLQANRDDQESSKFKRRIIKFGFQKMNLDDVDFKDENLDLQSVVSTKFNELIEETSKPSPMYFIIIAAIQIILVICSFVF